ncbi:unnamed protein product [Rotaria magnacalcarata]|uniref:cyclin-dependent kinase n=6 Tax=Rotaria magnacalcarata TaxID=392030 RepID=A0A816LID1_9BILA|nr:unnamed protein product [Rotaria magnacalcarata]CAF1654149.1 unnamed protein product [Rotaria magnacalcarata]CAF1933614.1 unnamed protein product [Rotaria magnacalcarata]CAF2097423.1 unnamed protein product [Rotaria magnacalcarata]CAF3951330.1 unnamed protein product [Rotaria magnacalcarata]
MLSTESNSSIDGSWNEIEDYSEPLESDFERIGKLGGGTYGDVFCVRHRLTGEMFALKQIRDDNEVNGIPATAMREAAILKQLNHQNIIKLYDVFLTDERCYFLLEYMDEDLKRYLDRNRPLDRQMIKNFMYQLFDAMFYCHKHRIIHRDIKPHNILVNHEHQLKLCDFGLGRAFSVPLKSYTHEIVTLWYRAPEILLGSPSYGTPVDMWSLGCIFGEMYQGWPLFHGDSEIDQIFQIFKLLGTPSGNDWPNVFLLPQFKSSFPKFTMQKIQLRQIVDNDEVAYDLLKRLLICDPTIRMAARYALEHSYFAGHKKTLSSITNAKTNHIQYDENNNVI